MGTSSKWTTNQPGCSTSTADWPHRPNRFPRTPNFSIFVQEKSMKYLALTDEVLEKTLQAGEFPEEIRNAGEKVVVILTQDWCHDWHDMQAFLPDFEGQAVFFLLEYNRHPA